MATASKPRYANYPIEPELFDALGLDPAEAGVPEIRAALNRYRQAIDHARTTLGDVLDRQELSLIADVMNGTWLVGDWMNSFRVMVVANIQDTEWPEDRHGVRKSVCYADKWFGEGLGANRAYQLLRKLQALPSIQIDALALAVRDFWRDPEVEFDWDWWLPNGGR